LAWCAINFAARADRRDLIAQIVSLCTERGYTIRWDEGMKGASFGGHIALFKYMYERHMMGPLQPSCERYRSDRLDHSLFAGAKGGHIHMIQYVVDLAASCPFKSDEWEYGFCGAAAGGHIEALEYFIQPDEPFQAKGFIEAISFAGAHGHIEAAEWIIQQARLQKERTHPGQNFDATSLINVAIYHAALHERIPLITFYTNAADPIRHKVLWNEALAGAAAADSMRVVTLCIDNGADDWADALNANQWEGNGTLVPFFEAKMGGKVQSTPW
jgi:hypothetical protein